MIKINQENVSKHLTEIEALQKQDKYKFSIKNYFIEKGLKNYFDSLIIENLLTNDKIIDFFDKNEFGLGENNTIIYKKDVIDENTFYGTMRNNKVLQNYVNNEFKQVFLKLLDDANINFDIENYIMITCLIEEQQEVRVYTITFQYYRNFIVSNFKDKFNKLVRKYSIIGGITVSILIGLLTYFLLK